MKLLRRGIPPIVRIRSTREAYGKEVERIPHYVVVKGIDEDEGLRIADPWCDRDIPNGYWDKWTGSIIAVEAK